MTQATLTPVAAQEDSKLSHNEWLKELQASPSHQTLLELLGYLGLDSGFTDVKRSRVWEEVRRADIAWDEELLTKVALTPEGPPDSKGWLWLLEHPQTNLTILRRVGFLACTYGDKYYHGGRFARKALKELAEKPSALAVKLLSESMTLELARERFVTEKEYQENFNKLFSKPQAHETFNQLHLDVWSGSVKELIEVSIALS